MMKKYALLPLFLWMFTAVVHADLMHDLLVSKNYSAHCLSAKEIDSLLNDAATEERYILKHKNKQQQYRYSFFADYYLYDTKKKAKFNIADTLVRDASFSPNGKYIAYGRGQDLYLYKTDFKTSVPVARQGHSDVFCGVSDWLYEEEFGITRMYAFSPDSKQLAFVRLDETDVPAFTWQTFLPTDEQSSPYPINHRIRYPKTGQKNAVASVWIYDIHDKTVQQLKLPQDEDQYIPRIVWRTIPVKSDKGKIEANYELMVQVLNRDQTDMTVYACNPKSLVCRPFYREQSDRYFVDYALFDQWQWMDDGRVLIVSEKDDWRRVYLLSAQGMELRALSPTGMDVTTLYGVNPVSGMVYYQAAPVPTDRQVYATTIKSGVIMPLTAETGTHKLFFSKDWKQCIHLYESDQVPPQYTLCKMEKNGLKILRSIENNAVTAARWKALALPQKQFLKIPTERGDSLYAWIIRPAQQQQGKRYPVVMLQYSGPASQRVLNRWHHRFAYILAEQGYIVVNADPRGTDCRGRQWRNQTYLQLGMKEAEDHLSVARYMQALPEVDAKHIAMVGWSYGGYQTIRTLCEQDSVNPAICCGVAIAPVTDWRLYDTGYTERYMRRPMVNEDGYLQSDLTGMADRLTGHLLLVHGLADDNVHVQNTWLLTEALVNAGKQFEMQVYPDDNHSLRNGKHYLHLHNRILLFLKQYLYD